MNRRLEVLRFAFVFLAVAVPGCATTPDPSPQPETRVELDEEGRISYMGSITSTANERAMDIFDRAEEAPETVFIVSGGGGIEAALDLGEWIHEHDLNVELGDACISSCANYVFVAGNVKKLRRGSMLVWHGSAWQESWDHQADPEHPDYDPELVELRERESRFFDRVGVDNVITVYGQGRVVRWYDYIGVLFGRFPQGYDYDLEDLARMGVTDIRLVDGEWDPEEYSAVASQVRIRRVSLDEDYEFTLSRFSQSDPAEHDN